MTALWLLVGILATCAFALGMLRAPTWLWLVLFGGLGATLPLIGGALGIPVTIFGFVKTISVGAAGIAIAALRSGWRPDWVRPAFWIVMAVNIAEAVMAEAADPVQPFNPIAGLVLIACMAGPSTVSARREGPTVEANWALGWDWVVAYTVWNAVFVYSSGAPGEAKGIWMWVAILHLGVPLLLTLGRSERWAELRALCLFVVMCWVDLSRTEPWVQHSEGAFSETVALVVQGGSLALAVAVAIRHLVSPDAPPSPLRSLGARLFQKES